MQDVMWQGSWVALITPMKADGSLDQAAFCALLRWHVSAGTSGIVLLGTTAESPTLSEVEKKDLLALAKDTLQGALPLVVGVGSNATDATSKAALWAQEGGADGLMVVNPYYNKPPQRGLIAHFKAIAERSDLPIMLYDHPGRTGVKLSLETLEALYAVPSICGIKDATGDLSRVSTLRSKMPRWSVLTGNDEQVADFLKLGGHGVVSVAANVVPQEMVRLSQAFGEGNPQEGESIAKQLAPLFDVLVCDSNPIPVKWALHAMGRIDAGIRLPLVVAEQSMQKQIEQVLIQLGL